MNKISIIIPIYNRLEITKRGLDSVFLSLKHYETNNIINFQFKIIVIDDGSKDGSSEWINAHFPDIIILKGDGNLWWTGSVNLGSRFAVENLSTNYILLWNDDTLCEENYFLELTKTIESNLYSNSILVSKIYWLNEDNILFNFGCLFNKFTGNRKGIGFNQPDSKKFSEVRKVDWSGGMGTLIPTMILLKLDFFDAKRFPQYFGDFDFFLRANKNGFNAFAIPSLKIFNERETTGIYKAKNFKEFKNLLFSNQSMYNLKQNIEFTKLHANTVISWIRLFLIYFYHTLILFRNIVFSKKNRSIN